MTVLLPLSRGVYTEAQGKALQKYTPNPKQKSNEEPPVEALLGAKFNSS